MKRWPLALAALLPGLAAAQGFDNSAVIALHRAGLGDAAILAKIQASPCDYDTSAAKLVALKQAGVSDAVIAAMIQRCAAPADATVPAVTAAAADPAAPHSPGIYLWEDWRQPPRLERLHPSSIAGLKVTGNGSLLFPRVARATVPQPAAQTAAPAPRPAFYFYFHTSDGDDGGFGTDANRPLQSPTDFALVRLHPTGGNREFLAGRVQPYLGNTGVEQKDTVPFTSSELGAGSFRVEPAAPLAAGEYAFVAEIDGHYGRTAYRIFDFAVRPPK